MSAFVSGKIEVFQFVLPMVTEIGKEPQPRASEPYNVLISLEILLGTVRKCQLAVSPGYTHNFALNEKFFFFMYVV